MPPLNLTPIQARLEQATPGPWVAVTASGGKGFIVSEAWIIATTNDKKGRFTLCRFPSHHNAPDSGNIGRDADLIAHAPPDLSACLQEITRLRAEVARMEEQLRSAEAGYD